MSVSFVDRQGFLGCSNYPECKFTRPLSKAKAAAQYNLAEPKLLGQNDKGKDIFLKLLFSFFFFFFFTNFSSSIISY